MKKMSNSEHIELCQESNKTFLALRLEIERVFQCLKDYESNSSFESKKVGIYKYLKKLIPCFDILFEVSKLNSTQSLITQLRMIVDNYVILYLFTNFSSKEEQLLRYYLFLLDATSSRPKIINNFASNIKHQIPDEAYENANIAVASDNKTTVDLIKLINERQLDAIANKEIISSSNWKFKDKNEKNQNKNRYIWTELYTIAKIPNHHAQILQNYFSSFVHGLGLSLNIKADEEDLTFVILSLDYSVILMSLIIKIIITEFDEETKNLNLHPMILKIINQNWNNWK